MTRSFQLVDNKVFEADYFLNRFSESGFDILAARSNFSAFVSAARSITFVLQAVMRDVDGFDDWYSMQQENLRSDPISCYFLKIRNELQKIGITPIQGAVNFLLGQEGYTAEYKFGSPWLDTDDPPAPEHDVLTACRQYLVSLIEIIEDCYVRFGSSIDPHQYLTLKNLDQLGLSIEDIEGFASDILDRIENRFEILDL